MKQAEVNQRPDAHTPHADAEMDETVAQEEKVLARVHRTIRGKRPVQRGRLIDYDAELIALRDQINEARLEDIPPLIEEMERLQQVAQRRAQVTEGTVDAMSPYFGRLVLEEEERKREILIGRSTYLDSKTGVRIVDWRDAPVSRVYYRYEEGDDYDEIFGDREVEGEVLVRRNLSITGGSSGALARPRGRFADRGTVPGTGSPIIRRSSRVGREPQCVPSRIIGRASSGLGRMSFARTSTSPRSQHSSTRCSSS